MSTDDKKILETVLSRMDYSFTRDMLVKPLPDEFIEKEIVRPVETDEKDENGYIISTTETVVEKVPTTFKKGIVLAIPNGYQWPNENDHPEVGDTVVFSRKSTIDFDIFKDSQLVNPYNIVCFIKSERSQD